MVICLYNEKLSSRQQYMARVNRIWNFEVLTYMYKSTYKIHIILHISESCADAVSLNLVNDRRFLAHLTDALIVISALGSRVALVATHTVHSQSSVLMTNHRWTTLTVKLTGLAEENTRDTLPGLERRKSICPVTLQWPTTPRSSSAFFI